MSTLTVRVLLYWQAMQSNRKTKMDEFEYVTYGKIFKYEHAGVDQNTNAVSFPPRARKNSSCMLCCIAYPPHVLACTALRGLQ